LRELADFFGADAAEIFDQKLQAAGGPLENHLLDLGRVPDPAALAAAFRVLIESQTAEPVGARKERFGAANRAPFLNGPRAGVHAALLALADEYPHVWLEGMSNYGLRVAHPNHPGGVSVATSRGVNHLEIGRPR
jgi:hypothetical protein